MTSMIERMKAISNQSPVWDCGWWRSVASVGRQNSRRAIRSKPRMQLREIMATIKEYPQKQILLAHDQREDLPWMRPNQINGDRGSTYLEIRQIWKGILIEWRSRIWLASNYKNRR